MKGNVVSLSRVIQARMRNGVASNGRILDETGFRNSVAEMCFARDRPADYLPPRIIGEEQFQTEQS